VALQIMKNSQSLGIRHKKTRLGRVFLLVRFVGLGVITFSGGTSDNIFQAVQLNKVIRLPAQFVCNHWRLGTDS
jgi:hypothetical protein